MFKQNNNPSQWFIDQLNVFQSANSDHQSIKNNFIVRLNEFNIIIDSLTNKDTDDSLQNELILGRRGSGKSTLLKRIEIEVLEKHELSSKYIPINLAEEQAGIYRLFDLWDEVLKELNCHWETHIVLKLYSEFNNDQDFTRYLYQEIHETCVKLNKKVVLLLDNFDRIVENFTDDGNLLRETLINYNDVVIIAGSTRMDEHFWGYDMPFYEFFRRHRLEALDREELNQLLHHWSKALDLPQLAEFITNNKGKIENIRLLTDGLPRTIQFYIQMVLQDAQADSYEYLKKIMDNVTPLYQERLNYQTPQLRKIILEMAFLWEACTTKQLVDKCRMESKLISANLKTLTERGIVEKIETSKKNHLYRLSERFFNMWLIVTQGNPEQKRRAKWLSIFLENWYDVDDLRKLADKHIKLLSEKEANQNDAIIMSKALSQCKYITLVERDRIIELTSQLKKNDENSLISLPEFSDILIKDIQEFIEKNNYDEALKLADTIDNEEDGIKFFVIALIQQQQNKFTQAIDYYKKSIEKGNIEAMFNLALLYYNQEKFSNAEKYYLMAIEKGSINAINNLAILYDNQKKIINAEKYFLMAVDKGNVDAMFNLALLYKQQEKFSDTEKYFLMAIEKGDVDSMFNLALLYYNQDKFTDAEKLYLMAIEKGNIAAINNLAILYKQQGKFTIAEKYYLMAIEKGDVDAMNNLATLFYNQEKFNDAERFYLMAIEKEHVGAINNLALLYYNQGKFADSEKYYIKAIMKEDVEAMNNLATLFYNQEKFTDAEKYYLMAIEKEHVKAMFNLVVLYFNQNKNKDKVLDFLYRLYKADKSKLKELILAEIWNGIFDNTEERILSIIQESDDDLDEFFFDLLVHQQKHLVMKLFNNQEFGKQLQDKYKVMYYVAQKLTDTNDENLDLRIPPEIKSTIDDVMARVAEKERFYGYRN
jgi:TPR repeat protein